jgi:cytochrome bd-type quinol oxidase subunit 2
MEIEARIARKNITFLWFILGGFIVAVFIFQQLNGKFEEKSQEAWLWISANLLPFFALVLGGYLLDVKKRTTQRVDKSYYKMSFGFSLFYLLTMVLVVFSYPFSDKSILEYYRDSNIYLIPLQSIVTACIGVFFIKGK